MSEKFDAHSSALTVVIPVWGEYWKHLNNLLPVLRDDGLAPEQIIIVANGEPIPSQLLEQGYGCTRTSTQQDIGSVRNAGLQLVNTRYVLFCDADDLPAQGAISALLQAMQGDPRAVAATGYNQRTDGNLYPWPYEYMPALSQHRWRLLLKQWGWNQMFIASGTILRTRVLVEAGGFPAMDLAEDGALLCLLCYLGPILFLNRATRVYQIHPQGLCQQGHSAKRWKQAYKQQRLWLRASPLLPRRLRLLTYLYAPVHHKKARELERTARYDYGGFLDH